MSEAKILTVEEIAEIEVRANAATKGPWKSTQNYLVVSSSLSSEPPCRMYNVNRRNNNEFIAHAREDIPALCATVRHLVAENEKLNAIVSAYENQDEEALAEAENL